MYLKILSRDDDKTNTFIEVQRVEFFHLKDTPQGIRDVLNYCDLSFVENAITQADASVLEDTICVGCFNLVFESGKKLYIIFDGVAFLCNDSGKTVDRFLAN